MNLCREREALNRMPLGVCVNVFVLERERMYVRKEERERERLSRRLHKSSMETVSICDKERERSRECYEMKMFSPHTLFDYLQSRQFVRSFFFSFVCSSV